MALWLSAYPIYAIIARMFIQLTRTDGVPVWLNASFVVTIEPARGGGSVVVPIGDGLDYEVSEAPEAVLAMLEGAQPPKVVPVPPPKTLTPRPDDVSPDANAGDCGGAENAQADGVPQKKAGKAKKAASAKSKSATAEPEPKKKRATTKKKSAGLPPPPPAPIDGFEKIAEDLKSRKCRTVKRMRNAIKSFHGKNDSAEIDGIIEMMINNGCILIAEDGRVNWSV